LTQSVAEPREASSDVLVENGPLRKAP
jgi:hypothetical protein